MIKPGQILSRLCGIINQPSHCQRWGCILPVGKDSSYGFGPVCMVCSYGLRAQPPEHPGEAVGNTSLLASPEHTD